MESTILTNAHRRDFDEKGYLVWERVIPDALVAQMRDACGSLMTQIDARVEARRRTRLYRRAFSP